MRDDLSQQALKSIALLRQKKHRIESQAFLVEGARLVREALASTWTIEKLLCTAKFQYHALAGEIFAQAGKRQIERFQLRAADFKKISQTVAAPGVAVVVRFPTTTPDLTATVRSPAGCFLLAIDRLNDPGNLGTILRTASWFGVDGVLLGESSVVWHNPKVVRASMGAIFQMPIHELPTPADFLAAARRQGAAVFGADQGGELDYRTLPKTPAKILVIGHETEGLSPEAKKQCTATVRIPRRGQGESLNASVAAAILIAELARA